MQNAFLERFNKTYRAQVLDDFSFVSFRRLERIQGRMEDYSHRRPNRSQINCSRIEYANNGR